MKEPAYSLSALSMTLGSLDEQMKAAEEAKCDELHFDVGDGLFSPHFGMNAGFIKAAKTTCGLPCHAHLMAPDPERHVDRFLEAGADGIILHVEACTHAHRVLGQIKEGGASPGVAINPGTSLTKLEYLLQLAERVVVMAAEPGAEDGPFVKNTFERVRILRQNLDYLELNARLAVRGPIDLQTAATLAACGADVLMLDASSGVFGTEIGLAKAFAQFKSAVATGKNLA